VQGQTIQEAHFDMHGAYNNRNLYAVFCTATTVSTVTPPIVVRHLMDVAYVLLDLIAIPYIFYACTISTLCHRNNETHPI